MTQKNMARQEYPAVVFVILTCNQTEMTLLCLESLHRCNYPNFHIVLVDNGSEDDVRAAVGGRFPEVTVLRNAVNRGAAGGRNTGIDYAREHLDFRYIMFMDNDIVVQPDFLGNMVDALENCRDEAVEIATPLLYKLGSDRIIDCAGGAQLNFYTGSTQTRGHGEKDVGQYDDDPHPDCVPTTVLMHRRALDRAGGFDVAFDPYGYEDLDMVLRANPQRAPYLFVPTAVVHHKGQQTGFSGYNEQYTRRKGENLRRFLARHSTPLQRCCFHALLPLLAARTVLRELRRGNFGAIAGLVRGFLRGGR